MPSFFATQFRSDAVAGALPRGIHAAAGNPHKYRRLNRYCAGHLSNPCRITAIHIVNAAIVSYLAAPLHGESGRNIDSCRAIRCYALISPSNSSTLVVEGQGDLTVLPALLNAIYKRDLLGLLLCDAVGSDAKNASGLSRGPDCKCTPPALPLGFGLYLSRSLSRPAVARNRNTYRAVGLHSSGKKPWRTPLLRSCLPDETEAGGHSD